jgi:hypothetical protein
MVSSRHVEGAWPAKALWELFPSWIESAFANLTEGMGEIVRRSLEAPIKVKIAGETEDKRSNFGFRSHLRWLSCI